MATASKTKTIVIEQAKDGTLWGRLQYGEDLLTTSGNDLKELQQNFCEQLEGFYDLDASKLKFEYTYDIGAFFECYSELNISAIAEKAGINASLLRQYKNRMKFPSQAQVQKLEDAIHVIGQELSKVTLVSMVN
jgi:hypothetical protein